MSETFFDAWNIYKKVVLNNYMYHKEITQLLMAEAKNFSSLSILDIGCGDSHTVTNAVNSSQLNNYVGIDSSEAALKNAKKNLLSYTGNISLINGDMIHEIKKLSKLHDLVVAGYSLHHLNTSTKRKVISNAFNILTNNGLFIFYDVMTKTGESEHEYNERACHIFRKEWTELTLTEINGVISHVMQSDHPESEDIYREIFLSTGFKNINLYFRDKDDLFSFFIAKK